MLNCLLNYWYSLEFFQPGWPVREKEDTNLLKAPLPWLAAEPDPKTRISYDLYFGRSIAYDLIVWALERLGLMAEDSPIERDQSRVCLCALKVDQNGVYVPESFAVSSFAWALGQMVQANDFGVKLDMDALEKLQGRFDTTFTDKEEPFSLAELKRIPADVCSAVGVEAALFSPALWARKKTQYQKKDGTFPPLDPATELMASYYVREIACVKKNPGKQVKRYAEALYPRPHTKTIIDSDTTAMRQWLEAGRFPRGAWPSTHSPSLMQQLAINLAISGQEMFSVNGPPGTGKTTLLKEIVASNIVQRAVLMAAYARPDDAFQKNEFPNPPDQYNRTFYRPDSDLAAYGMLVASNNNAAVENISIELPKAVGADRTGRFTNTDDPAETYFSDVATALLDEPAWGLISARLGKKTNLREFKEKLWWNNEGVSLQQYYNQPSPDWDAARRNFYNALQAVEDEQAAIARVQASLGEYLQAMDAQRAESVRMAQCQAVLDEQARRHDAQRVLLEDLEGTHALQQQNAAQLKASLSWFKRRFPRLFKNNPVIQEWKQTEQACGETLVAITRQRTVLHTHEKELETARRKAHNQKAVLQKAAEKVNRLDAALEPNRERFGANFADSAFWQDICANEDSQMACPWTDDAYDALREELFYRALMLQKAFVLGSNSVKQNLNRLFGMWDGKFSMEDREAAYGSLLNTLFFVVPVVSNTFASVQSFLEGVQPGELGTLVIDEAGQATPQSALGALWRTQKAIVVGDPLQVEPIMTTPLELCKRFAKDNDLLPIYRVPELSVQMLADARNPYGGLREMNGESLWLGCPLVVHRRCIEPMFTMSNRIAYNGRMFSKTRPPSPETRHLLEKSIWFDVAGNEIGGKNHTVPGQIDLAARLMDKAVAKFGGLPDIYFITPFTSVRRSLMQRLRPLLKSRLPEMDVGAIDDWLDSNCGTIHTFQGKEANEVLIVLGCDRQQGMGAAHWVGQKPNIINVAVSRAKHRVGVIGSYELWNRIPHVQVVCEMLQESVEKVAPG